MSTDDTNSTTDTPAVEVHVDDPNAHTEPPKVEVHTDATPAPDHTELHVEHARKIAEQEAEIQRMRDQHAQDRADWDRTLQERIDAAVSAAQAAAVEVVEEVAHDAAASVPEVEVTPEPEPEPEPEPQREHWLFRKRGH